MAIHHCSECSGIVSSKARGCPHCGAPADEIDAAVGSTVPLQQLRMDEPQRGAFVFKSIPPNFHSIIAQQLFAGVSIETSVQQLVAAGYNPEDARRWVQAVSACTGASLQLNPDPGPPAFTVRRIVAIAFCGLWSFFGVLLFFRTSSLGNISFVISGAVTAFALLTALFLAMRKDGAAQACCLLPGILTIPLGIGLILIVKFATTRKKSNTLGTNAPRISV